MAFEGCGAEWKGGLYPAISGDQMAFALNATPRFDGPDQRFRNVATLDQPRLLPNQEGAAYVLAGEL